MFQLNVQADQDGERESESEKSQIAQFTPDNRSYENDHGREF
jgi:hypothetical protein